MYELYFLIAIITNVIADLMIWREVKVMRISHKQILLETESMKILIEKGTIDMKPLLEDHAGRLAKSLAGFMSGLIRKEKKEAQEAQEGIDSSIGGLGDLIKLAQQIPDSGKSGSKFMH